MSDYGFDLGEYAPDKMLEYGHALIVDFGTTNDPKQQSIAMQRQLMELFKKEVHDVSKMPPTRRPFLAMVIIHSVITSKLDIDVKSDIDRMKKVNLADWPSAEKELIEIIDDMIKKIEA